MSATMEGILKGFDDPRRMKYFDPAKNGDQDGDGDPYEGLQNGQTKVALGTSQNPLTSDVKFIRDVAQGGANPPLEWLQAEFISC